MFGRQGNRFFVNSADAIGRSDVDRLFGNAATESGSLGGSIPLTMVVEQLGPDAVVGTVAIRRMFEGLYAAEKGKMIGAERARQLLRPFEVDYWRPGTGAVPVSYVSSLSCYAAACDTSRTEGIALRSKNLLKGRAK